MHHSFPSGDLPDGAPEEEKEIRGEPVQEKKG
jgi:hypothetical protein